MSAALVIALLVGYAVKFGVRDLPAVAWWINGGMMGVAIAFAAIAMWAPMRTAEEAGVWLDGDASLGTP
ncbi:MAG: hypothetical protein QM736_11835 [Vicinamibacterales bacterium]